MASLQEWMEVLRAVGIEAGIDSEDGDTLRLYVECGAWLNLYLSDDGHGDLPAHRRNRDLSEPRTPLRQYGRN